MARDETPPFKRGQTYHNGGTIDTNNYEATHLEGKEWVFEDNTYGTGFSVTCRVVRNVSGGALLPKRAVVSKTGYLGRRVDGYCYATDQAAYIVDEFLPAGGVPNGDLFYVVTEGPTLCKTSLAGNGENVITEGAVLGTLTAVTSGATTSGRLIAALLTGATAVLGAAINNQIGRALTARTTANTNADNLIYVKTLY